MAAKQENHLESNIVQGTSVNAAPLFLRQLSPEMKALLDRHFWCDFSDIIPAMAWDDISGKTPQ